jgi:hypothetical protein
LASKSADVLHHLTPRYLRLWLKQLFHAIKPCQTAYQRNPKQKWMTRKML